MSSRGVSYSSSSSSGFSCLASWAPESLGLPLESGFVLPQAERAPCVVAGSVNLGVVIGLVGDPGPVLDGAAACFSEGEPSVVVGSVELGPVVGFDGAAGFSSIFSGLGSRVKLIGATPFFVSGLASRVSARNWVSASRSGCEPVWDECHEQPRRGLSCVVSHELDCSHQARQALTMTTGDRADMC